MNEKQNLEKRAVQQFVRLYSTEHRNLEYISVRDMPDVLTRDLESNTYVGIEVTDLFYDQFEAKMMLGKTPVKSHPLMNESELIKRLNELLIRKSESVKRYEFTDELFLLIEVPSPMFREELFEKFKKNIKIPQSRYSEIWLLLIDQENGKEIIQLIPNKKV